MKTFLKRLQAWFVDGLIILVPVILSLYISFVVFNFVYRLMGFALVFIPNRFDALSWFRPAVTAGTVLLTILLIWGTGLIIRTLFGQRLNQFFESLFSSLPLTRSLFRAFKQLLGMLFSNRGREYSDVVLLPFPYSRGYAFGFITGRASPALVPDGAGEWFKVFVPGTPNPTIGYLLIVPSRDLTFTSLSVDKALRIIVSGGILGE